VVAFVFLMGAPLEWKHHLQCHVPDHNICGLECPCLREWSFTGQLNAAQSLCWTEIVDVSVLMMEYSSSSTTNTRMMKMKMQARNQDDGNLYAVHVDQSESGITYMVPITNRLE
jgi:hypothetical protein